MKTIICLLFLIFIASCYSQFQEWAKTYNGAANFSDEGVKLAVDAQGNCYVLGDETSSGFDKDICVVKYNSVGAQQWAKVYNGPANDIDEAKDIALDAQGNIYVTGITYIGPVNFDIVVIKYNPSGVQQWAQIWGGAGNFNDISAGIYADISGNVYVCGNTEVTGTNSNYITLKYNTSGTLQWAKQYNHPVNSSDYAYFISGEGGNIYVTGTSSAPGTGTDMFTIKYNSGGDSLWTARYNGTNQINEIPSGIACDASGNAYVTCRTQGVSSGTDYMTIKYNAGGTEQWATRYTSPGNSQDIPEGLAIDGSGNVYVTGRVRINSSYNDFGTVKYNSTGVQQWFASYNNSLADGDDYGYDIAVDGAGNVYVTGNSQASGSDRDALTIKYNSSGNELWVARYDVTNSEETFSIGLNSNNEVYVAGYQQAANIDFLTIKYSQTSGINILSNEIPAEYKLRQNYPNPFNPVTNIEFSLPKASFAELIVFDVLGREISALVNERLSAGVYRFDFDASGLTSGVYFYRLESGNFSEVKKMNLIK
jgi:uncharacterized delta-60 repeat protein